MARASVAVAGQTVGAIDEPGLLVLVGITHADTPELLEWLHTFTRAPKETFLVHGEPDAASQLRNAMTEALGWNVQVAAYQEKVQLDGV